ncbi:YggS family pyridoxal phosphate-dependent enzyme [Corynebacterium glucuronolyticum]|uniref:YggS family pyridoxal phosphate-dependent enzyme n=1 Tax=Corynebacterium glucuronolyticum TaxID=39791 RepID=UPI00019C1FC1|nr:YggS family pyridoxal phosphate-dependent enzyme [Corynebacterium glucuronolyticum]EEI26741.1 pyridoxal phosphate enzyme, YggS family [Corynebacterium glucuronolyticum ATCC 51867]QRO82932.1 YggS family pyridoxal phosphate-dependent enzyme [Corynebacterium glucuronolyticum]
MAREDEIAAGLQRVRQRIAEAKAAAGRTDEVRLLPVTKFHPASDVEILHSLGIEAVGENRDQEAKKKAAEFPSMAFHMLGQIQTKKANSVARWASAVQSVDSLTLVQALDRGMQLALDRGDRTTETLDVYVQLSLDGDESRGGVIAADVPFLVEAIEGSTHLRLVGLMCVPPVASDADEAFATALDVKQDLDARAGHPLEFSAGMSADLEVAIKNGSTLVRVGTDILGPRQIP